MKISKTMQEVLDYVDEHGGKIFRFTGGFWAREGILRSHTKTFGTSSIEALVERGLLAYTQWKQNPRGKFPVVAERVN